MSAITLFEEKQVRRAWNKAEEKWYFANVDVIAILTSSDNPQVYWRVMKKRLSDEGNETVSNCNALKMTAADGKQRLTDVAGTEQLLRLIQSSPSPKAEPFKQVDYERLQEIENPELAAKRMRQIYEHVCPHSTPGLPPRHLQPLPRGHRPPPRLRVPASSRPRASAVHSLCV